MEMAARMLQEPIPFMDDALSDMIPGAEPDPYVHCMISSFTLSFYYQADTAAVMSTNYQLALRGWPRLDYVAPHVHSPRDNCVSKIKLGVISGALSEGHSVTEDFSGILSRLDRNIFQVTYIFISERFEPAASFTRANPTDISLVWTKQVNDTRHGDWTLRYSRDIAQMQLDMILYLDLTMSTHVRRLGMGRLAPVQLVTHGHPVTSGHPNGIIQYYVSWSEAEAELPTAQAHYTETLLLLPKGQIHQWYEQRILPGEISRMDGLPFGRLTRRDFDLPSNVTIYLNMQKPFKLHYEYDALVCGILRLDPTGHVAMHREDNPQVMATILQRLKGQGCDLTRIHWIPAQPHHRLLALYKHSTVILDSYPAGGCTTTREVLELGKAVVTLPARLLGGRWTLGYYNIILKDDFEATKRHVIAENASDYLRLAVAMGTNESLRNEVGRVIGDCVGRLFHRHEAVVAWTDLLVRVSPVQHCQKEALRDEL
jgi:predicted O-linked N-acetylglucosamine transferase (SPINDLY family)